jgi:hypothetical protein
MGEREPISMLRVAGVAALVVAAMTTLSSCSQPAGAPAAATSSPSVSDVQDPSVPSATPTESIASDTPAPVVTPVATSTPSSTADARGSVVPFITTAAWDASAKAVDVSAIVPGVVEGDGICTVTLTSGGTTRTATSHGVAASSYTGCPAVAVRDLAAGTWQVRVRYSSAKSVGSSEPGKNDTVQVG